MVIVHVLSSFDVGGQEGMAVDLSIRQRERGHAVFAVSLSAGEEGPRGADFRRGGVGTFAMPKRPGFDPAASVRLARLFSTLSADIVHTHNPQALVYGAPAGRLAGARVVHTKHGKNPDPVRRRLLRRVSASCVCAYVSVSPTTGEVAKRNRECAPWKMLVIENGVDVLRFVPDPHVRRAVRRELGIRDDAWVIGTVGRLAKEKDYPLLLRAALPLLSDRHRLVFVGDGPERDSLEALIRRNGATAHVLMTGMRNDTHRLLCALDVFALSSATEGLPLVVPEAMAAALPIVSTAVGGIPDVLDPDNSILVPPADETALRQGLSTLFENRDRAQRMGRAARAAALSRYSSERMLQDYMTLYERVARARRKAWNLSPSSLS